ncbi:hypothetical protein ALC56_09180 [Trachymyrmex septentrionalis]|uniref:Uncharacterized protein n=1 Tax=Trachymyrmex septentrionalis TaxID=34720 RepID=A0A195F6J4_9HYME|nr:hypothetical protein ALC56_09180 [Trachymyrmex septentrionalis]
MGLVRRYSEINRSAKEEAANGDDRREKSWFTKKGSGVLLGDEDYTDIAHGVGPQKMHPETQPLSSRAYSYSILALCFSTSVILVDDYIVGMLARPQPRTESRRDSLSMKLNSGPDFFGAREMLEYQSNSRHSQDSVEMRRRQCGRRSVEEKKGARIVNAPGPQFEPVSHNKL